MNKYALVLGLILCFSACGDSDKNCDQSFGTSFKVEEGRTYCLPDGSSLFIDSIKDSYCPCDAVCIWQGEAVIEASRTSGAGQVEALSIHEVLVDDNTKGYQIAAVAITKSCDPDIVDIQIVVDQ